MAASHTPSTGDLACSPGMCPDWEWNQQPFGSQAGAQSTEPHQLGLIITLITNIFISLVDSELTAGRDTIFLQIARTQ